MKNKETKLNIKLVPPAMLQAARLDAEKRAGKLAGELLREHSVARYHERATARREMGYVIGLLEACLPVLHRTKRGNAVRERILRRLEVYRKETSGQY